MLVHITVGFSLAAPRRRSRAMATCSRMSTRPTPATAVRCAVTPAGSHCATTPETGTSSAACAITAEATFRGVGAKSSSVPGPLQPAGTAASLRAVWQHAPPPWVKGPMALRQKGHANRVNSERRLQPFGGQQLCPKWQGLHAQLARSTQGRRRRCCGPGYLRDAIDNARAQGMPGLGSIVAPWMRTIFSSFAGCSAPAPGWGPKLKVRSGLRSSRSPQTGQARAWQPGVLRNHYPQRRAPARPCAAPTQAQVAVFHMQGGLEGEHGAGRRVGTVKAVERTGGVHSGPGLEIGADRHCHRHQGVGWQLAMSSSSACRAAPAGAGPAIRRGRCCIGLARAEPPDSQRTQGVLPTLSSSCTSTAFVNSGLALGANSG